MNDILSYKATLPISGGAHNSYKSIVRTAANSEVVTYKTLLYMGTVLVTFSVENASQSGTSISNFTRVAIDGNTLTKEQGSTLTSQDKYLVNQNGSVSVLLPNITDMQHIVELSATGYIDYTSTALTIVQLNGATLLMNEDVSQHEAELSLVMGWNPAPADLDMHVLITHDSTTTELSYSNSDISFTVTRGGKNYTVTAKLVRDVTSGDNPEENVYINCVGDSDNSGASILSSLGFTYYVHNWTNEAPLNNRGTTHSTGLFYIAGGTALDSFDVSCPDTSAAPYNTYRYWKVCTFSNGHFSVVNQVVETV